MENVLQKPTDQGNDASKKTRKNRNRNDEDTTLTALISEARDLSEYWFEEDVVAMCQKKGWHLAILVENGSLRGFLCSRFIATDVGEELVIERLGVPKPFRKRGFGAMLMQWIMEEAARMPL